MTFTANVNGGYGAAAPTGVVQFYDNGTLLAVVAVSPTGGMYTQAQAVYTTSSLALGSHVITAVYGGDAAFTASTASPLTLTIQQSSTNTWLWSSSGSYNPTSALGQAVTFTAMVTGNGSGAPLGAVRFYDNGVLLATVQLSAMGGYGSQAAFTTSDLSLGVHTITAVYEGDDAFASSNAYPLFQTVQ